MHFDLCVFHAYFVQHMYGMALLLDQQAYDLVIIVRFLDYCFSLENVFKCALKKSITPAHLGSDLALLGEF